MILTIAHFSPPLGVDAIKGLSNMIFFLFPSVLFLTALLLILMIWNLSNSMLSVKACQVCVFQWGKNSLRNGLKPFSLWNYKYVGGSVCPVQSSFNGPLLNWLLAVCPEKHVLQWESGFPAQPWLIHPALGQRGLCDIIRTGQLSAKSSAELHSWYNRCCV